MHYKNVSQLRDDLNQYARLIRLSQAASLPRETRLNYAEEANGLQNLIAAKVFPKEVK